MSNIIPIDFENDGLRQVLEKIQTNLETIYALPNTIPVSPTPPENPEAAKLWIDTGDNA